MKSKWKIKEKYDEKYHLYSINKIDLRNKIISLRKNFTIRYTFDDTDDDIVSKSTLFQFLNNFLDNAFDDLFSLQRKTDMF